MQIIIIVLFLLAVILPILLWFLFIRAQDTSEPEPKRLLRRSFFVGVGSVFGSGIIESVLYFVFKLPFSLTIGGSFLLGLSGFLAGPIEELSKYIVLRYSVYFDHEFNQVFDGIVYGILIALGFSLIENSLYFLNIYRSVSFSVFVVAIIFRGVFSTMLHVTATGITGLYVGKAKFSNGNRKTLIATGLIYASLLHGIFNYFLLSGIRYGGFFSILLVVTAFILFIRTWKKPEVRMVWKYTPPAPKAAIEG